MIEIDITMYAIQNAKTGKFVYGTDWRYNPPRQKTSSEQMMTWATLSEIMQAFKQRQCGKSYRIVKVKVTSVATVDEVKPNGDDTELS